jgi:hypothetical protein
MRPIDADKLFRNIPLKVCVPCPFGEEKECKDCVVENVMKMVDDAPTVEAASPWHRVENELPEIGKSVLVWDSGYYWLATRTDDEVWQGRRYWKNTDGEWDRIEKDMYWMPIEPPKEDADANK